MQPVNASPGTTSPRRVVPAAALALAALLALASPWLSAARADAAQATVVSPGGVQRTLALDALAGAEDVVNRAYALSGGAGSGSQTVTGFSLGAILEAAGADPFSFSYLEVQRPAGGAVVLSRHQALDPGAFADGPPVLYATAAGTGFLRPSAGAGDLNGDDSFEAPQGITIVLRKGKALEVRAEATPRRVEPGEKVSFEAIVERAGSGEQLAYSWYFDDGHSASGAKAVHSFAKPGTYDVVVGVTTPGDDVGVSAVVTVQVGEPSKGPNRKGGGENKRDDAPDHGVASGPSTGSTSGFSGLPGVSESPYTAPSPSPSPTPAPVPAEPSREQQPAPEPEGEEISGILLDSSAEETQPRERQQQAAARTGSLSDGEGGGGLPDAAWGLLATAGLLGAGALLEARGLSGLRLPRLPG